MHKEFILQSLYGLITQVSTFPFEIVCYEDCSSDGTREIVEEFSAKYPDIVRPYLPETNQYSNSNRYFFDVITPFCKGNYIAYCEGDDYWTDVTKIQKQTDFLENNPDFSLCYHNIATIDQEGRILNPDWMPTYYRREFTAQEVRLCWCNNQMLSLMYRNVINEIPDELRKAPTDDVFLISLLGKYGKAKYLNNINPSMYRQHRGGTFTSLSMIDKYEVQSLNFYWIYRYYKRKEQLVESQVMRLRSLERSLHTVKIAEIIRLCYVRIFRSRSKKILTIRKP